eukprot:9127052-Pyramimonas_sp.AAC.1
MLGAAPRCSSVRLHASGVGVSSVQSPGEAEQSHGSSEVPIEVDGPRSASSTSAAHNLQQWMRSSK